MDEIILELGLEIPLRELRFTFARSGGPGGQNVNKVESKVVLYLDVQQSPTFSDSQKERIAEKLASRMNALGELVLHASRFRSREANRKDAIERLKALLDEALKERPPRKKKKVPRAVRERRLTEKKQRGELKRLRQPPKPNS